MAARRAKILSSKLIYSGPIFDLRQERVVEPGGIEVTRDIVRHFGSVVLLPVLPDGRLLLVRQYRHAVGEFLWELVAGRIEPGESPLGAARRELLEETGYTARRFRKLLDLIPTPGYVSERMRVYAAHGCAPGAARPEADEHLLVKRFSLGELEAMMRRGTLRDAKSIAAVLYYARFNRRRAGESVMIGAPGLTAYPGLVHSPAIGGLSKRGLASEVCCSGAFRATRPEGMEVESDRTREVVQQFQGIWFYRAGRRRRRLRPL